MILKIYDQYTLDLLGTIGVFDSVLWAPTYNSLGGDFKIVCGLENRKLLNSGRFIQVSTSIKHLGVITNVITSVDEENKEVLEVKGSMCTELLARRVITKPKDFVNTSALSIAVSLINSNCINTSIERKIENLELRYDEELYYKKKVTFTACNSNLKNEISRLLSLTGLGIRIYREEHKLICEFYEGLNLSAGSENPVVFSRSRGSALATTYEEDESSKATYFYVSGDEEAKIEISSYGNPKGLDRVEHILNLSGEVECPKETVEVEPDDGNGEYYKYVKVNSDDLNDYWEKYSVTWTESQETYFGNVSDWIIVDDKDMTVEGFVIQHTDVKWLYDPGVVKLNKSKGFVLLLEHSALAREYLRTFGKYSKRHMSYTEFEIHPTISLGYGEDLPRQATYKIGVGGKYQSKDIVVVFKKTCEKLTSTSGEYEIGNLVETIQVPIGEKPSMSTKIIQGSYSSGDALVYENFTTKNIDTGIYKDMMVEKAKSYLSQFETTKSFSITPMKQSYLKLDKDYSLGDIVTCKDKASGASENLRISELTEIWDSTGYSYAIEVGALPKTFEQVTKGIQKGAN